MFTLEQLKKQKLVIYGAGFLGRDFIYFCKKHDVPIFWILDQKFNHPTKLLGISASSLEYFVKHNGEIKDCTFVIAIIKPQIVKEVKESLAKYGFKNLHHFKEVVKYKEYLSKFYSFNFLKNENSTKALKLQKNLKAKVGVIFHCYYLDLLEEFLRYLSNINDPFDLYISTSSEFKNANKEIFDKCKSSLKFVRKVKVLTFPNKGKDIYPFLKILKSHSMHGYECILKIHTKKSNIPEIGELWRKQMCIRLIGSPKIYEKIKSLFRGKKTGLVIPLGYAMEVKYYLGNNLVKLQKLFQEFKISTDYLYSSFFPLGSMFWFKPEVFKPLQNIDFRKIRFEEEKGQVDGTWAHAFERFFGVLPVVQGYDVLQIDEEGKVYKTKELRN